MTINDPLIHPALLDPRQWAEVDLYDATVNIEREAIAGDEHHTPDRKVSIKHLKLDLRFDYERRHVEGVAAFKFSPINDGLTHFDLDVAEMAIKGVTLTSVEERDAGDPSKSSNQTVGDQTVSPLSRRLEFETRLEKLEIEFDRPYARNELLTIEVEYSCSPRKGLFFVEPDEAYPNKPRQIWSQGENEDAHWWFPCNDVTNQKMTTEIIATVQSNFFALSNGELVGVSENNGDRTYHWRQSQPAPAYLVTIVIGEYQALDDDFERLPITYYVYKDRVREGMRLFGATPRMIEFFEEKFGHAYPYPKYAQILVDDFLFGAMENTSASTFTDRCLLDDPATIDLSYDDIVAHELAHQWWGDLVTCKDWSHIWLNESFATYSEYLWREHARGRDEARFALFQDFLTYLREDRTSHRRPIVFNRYRFSEDLMDRHAYEKGACVLDMLRLELGDNAFFRTLAHYLSKHEFRNAETNDFKVAIEEATGQNLHWFFDQWLYGPGHPEMEVAYEWRREQNLLKLSVKQLQGQLQGQVQGTEDGTRVFRFPVEIEIVTVEPDEVIEAERRASYQVVVEKAEQDFYFPCETKPRMVLFDKGHRVFKVMRFEKSAQELIFQLTRAEEAMDRARAARELSVFKGEDTASALREVLLGDDFYGVRMAAAVSLGEIGSGGASATLPDARAALPGARAALLDAYRLTKDSHVRRACVWALGNFKDEETVDTLGEALGKDESYYVAVAAARALAHIGGDKPYDILCASISRTSWQEVIAASIFHGFAQAKEIRAVELAIDHSKYGVRAPIRVAAVACLGALGKELNKEKKDDRVVDHLIEMLKDKAVRARLGAVKALGKIGNKRALLPLREAQRRECLDMMKGALEDAIKSLEEKAPA
ncbi:MAG TPA: M1 family aminopeptidase [Blastocatellia bacterium]|jgi:aminopeptidase N|nr:M1 family aminopeptidase [Blastocatellia bacterium]